MTTVTFGPPTPMTRIRVGDRAGYDSSGALFLSETPIGVQATLGLPSTPTATMLYVEAAAT